MLFTDIAYSVPGGPHPEATTISLKVLHARFRLIEDALDQKML
jgi:hypothetical protein